jgi:hypothetical protein
LKLIIETVDNGYIISDNTLKRVITEMESEAQTTRYLLCDVMEMLGILGSKHDAERCRVIVVDQDGKEI